MEEDEVVEGLREGEFAIWRGGGELRLRWCLVEF